MGDILCEGTKRLDIGPNKTQGLKDTLCSIEVFLSEDQIDITHGSEHRIRVDSRRENDTFGPNHPHLCLKKCLCQSRHLHLSELAQSRAL